MHSARGKVVLVGSDPGAAQVVFLLYEKLRERGWDVSVVARSAGMRVAEKLHIPITSESDAYSSNETIREYLGREKPNAIVCGTSLEDDLERNYITAGNAFSIPTVAVIDWWMNYKERFVHTKTHALCLPQWVCVNDEGAKGMVEKELGNAVQVLVTGNPYFLDALVRCTVSERDVADVAQGLHLNAGTSTILFIAEPIYPPYINQFEIFERIAIEVQKNLTAHQKRLNVIIKFHPSALGEDIQRRYREIAERIFDERCVVRLVAEYDIHTLIEAADYVWGMNSAPLLEAILRGVLTSSFLPEVPFMGVPFQRAAGFCPSADSFDQFPLLIEKLLVDESWLEVAKKQQKQYSMPKDRFIPTIMDLLDKEGRV